MTARLYIDVHSLFDLRQSVLVDMLGKEAAVDYVTSNDYSFRDVDVFPVDMAVFKKKMSDPSDTIFKYATITYMEVVLKSKLANLEKRNAFNQTNEIPEVVVNIYPYDLTTEQANVIRDAVFLKLGGKTQVTIIHEPVEK